MAKVFERIASYLRLNRAENWVAAAGGAVLGLLGGGDQMLRVLTIAMGMDYLSGVACAVKDGRLSSKVGFHGILRKLTIFLVVILSAQVDLVLSGEAVCRTATILFYLSNEAVSLLENAAALGLPIPQALRNILGQLRGEEKEK